MMSGEHCSERHVSSEAETALAGEIEADPYEVAEQVFQFRAKQLQAAGKLPQLAYEMSEEEFAVCSQRLTELYREIHEEMGLLWPPPWVGGNERRLEVGVINDLIAEDLYERWVHEADRLEDALAYICTCVVTLPLHHALPV